MASLIFVLVGLFVCVKGYLLGFGTYHTPGPGFIFIVGGSLLSILSLIDLIITSGRKNDSKKTIWLGLKWQKVILVLIALSAYAFFFERIGFLTSTFLLIVILFEAIESTRWWIAVLGGLVSTLMAHIIFNVWLKVPFPSGVLGF